VTAREPLVVSFNDSKAVREADEAWQRAAFDAQLEAFAGDSPLDWFLEIRIARKTGGMQQEFVPLGELAHAIEIIRTRSQQRDVYVGLAPRTRQTGKADAIEHSHVLWVDIDDEETAVRLLPTFSPRPNLTIDSGSGGVHAYWRLSEPLPAQFLRRANLRLAQRLGADKNACDPARIMRPIASRNHKHDPAREVRCRNRVNTPFDYEIGEIIGGLPDDPRYSPRPIARLHHNRPANPNRLIDGACRVVREAPGGERNSRLNWAAYRLGQRIASGELNGDVTTALLQAALDAGLPPDESLRTIASGISAATGRAAR
jgi:hypothetical protein